MPIRRARVADIAALVELELAFPTDRLSERSFRHLIRRGHADVWVYDEAGRTLGSAVVLYHRGTRVARLYSLVVTPHARGRGVGRALLTLLERRARRRGCAELRLEVGAGNRAAISLYRHRGYIDCGLLPGYYEDGTPARRMSKPLISRR